jgi:tetratricopeptide (TPR) repeat protein
MSAERIEKILNFLKENPKDCFLNHALALEYVKIGDEVAARNSFETNLTNNPAYVATYYHLAKLLERIGQTDNAIAMYEQGMNYARKAGDNHTLSELRSAYEDLVF